MKESFITGALYFGWAVKEEIAHRQTVEEIIDFLEIAPIRKDVLQGRCGQ
jgi:branched-chain amino acid transport system ATP-binding protein